MRLFALAAVCLAVPAAFGQRKADPKDWIQLFNGKNLDGWTPKITGYPTGENFANTFRVENGLMKVSYDGYDEFRNRFGHIFYKDKFSNYRLRVEYRFVGEQVAGGPGWAIRNSGVMFRVDPAANVTYESGPEMQVLDEAGHADAKSRLTAAGAAYGLYPAPQGVARGAESWNSARLVVNGAHVEHWLNGVKIVEYELWSDDCERRVQNSKFAQWPGYGRAKRGHIALQDHGDRVSFRNIRIRELP